MFLHFFLPDVQHSLLNGQNLLLWTIVQRKTNCNAVEKIRRVASRTEAPSYFRAASIEEYNLTTVFNLNECELILKRCLKNGISESFQKPSTLPLLDSMIQQQNQLAELITHPHPHPPHKYDAAHEYDFPNGDFLFRVDEVSAMPSF